MKTPDIPPSLRYKKYDWTELHKIDHNTLNEISGIDALYNRSVSGFERDLKKYKTNAIKTIIYLCYREKELVGAILGSLKPVSFFLNNKDYNINAKPNDNAFYLNEFFVKPKYQEQGIGTKLMARVIADQRANYSSKFMYMFAYTKTHRINEKLTATRPFIVPISETQITNKKPNAKNPLIVSIQKIKNIIGNLGKKKFGEKKTEKVFRNFKHSRYKYDLISGVRQGGYYNYIVIDNNPKYKKKQIRRRNTIRRSVAK
jgi:GNAT superfamily N-acetyltransferase